MTASDRRPLWERQPWDTQASFAAFQFYLEQEPSRSMLVAYRNYQYKKGKNPANFKQAPGSWKQWASAQDADAKPIDGAATWAQRAQAWDDFLLAEDRKLWIKRQREQREKEWEQGTRIVQRVDEGLMFPMLRSEQMDANGHVVTVIEPMDWTFSSLVTAAAQAMKMRRLAAGMDTEQVRLDWRREAQSAGVDPDAVMRELVAKIKAQLAGEAGAAAEDAAEAGVDDGS